MGYDFVFLGFILLVALEIARGVVVKYKRKLDYGCSGPVVSGVVVSEG